MFININITSLLGQVNTSPTVGNISTLNDTANTPYWIEMMQDPEANFFTTQTAFENYWQNNQVTKGCGWKPFKRWEHMMSTRVSTIGKKPGAEHIAQQYNSYFQTHAKSANGNWSELGPVQLPTNGTGQPNGLRRVNCVAFHPTLANTIWAGAPAGGLWKSIDNGATWSSNTDNLPTLGVSSILTDPTNATNRKL